MEARVGVKAKRELVRVVSERYRSASKKDKRRILDQFVAVTGHHRKHSIRLLNSTAELWHRGNRLGSGSTTRR